LSFVSIKPIDSVMTSVNILNRGCT